MVTKAKKGTTKKSKEEAPQEQQQTSTYNGNISGHIVRHQASSKTKQDDGSWRIFPPRLVATVVVELEDGSQKHVQVSTCNKRFELDEAYDREEQRTAVYNDLQEKTPIGVPCKVVETKGKEGRPLYRIELN